ncbi:MAG: hypothetical protein ACE361_19900 [Aureliella sp.]
MGESHLESDEPQGLNPYAPPESHYESVKERYHEDRLFRDGHFLVVLKGAAFPNLCFSTGRPTRKKFLWTHSWHTPWLNILLIAIVPYLVLSPLLSTRVHFEIPVEESILNSHYRLVRRGFQLLMLGALLFCGWCVLSMSSLYFVRWLPLLLISIVVGLLGFLISSREPVQLRIAKVEHDAVYLAGVHPNCLVGLPAYLGRS